MSIIQILLLLVACFQPIRATCWNTKPYQLGAKALAEATGTLSSAAICRYGNNTQIHASCPAPCWALISYTFGDCYCEDPDYKPKVSDPLVKSLTVKQLFELLAEPSKYNFQGASCQDKLNQSANKKKWQCN